MIHSHIKWVICFRQLPTHFWGIFSLFTEEEIHKIRNVTFYDVLVAVTSAEAADIQKNVFFWRDGKNKTYLSYIWFAAKYQGIGFLVRLYNNLC